MGNKGTPFLTSHENLSCQAAKQLAVTTKSHLMMEEITPRWLLKFLPWVATEAGTYRINKRKSYFPQHNKMLFNLSGENIYFDADELNRIKKYELLGPQLVKELAAQFEPEVQPKGTQRVANANDQTAFILAKGDIEISTLNERQERIILKEYTQGEYFDLKGLTPKSPITMTALDEVVIFVLTDEKFKALLEKHPSLDQKLQEYEKNLGKTAHEYNDYGEHIMPMAVDYRGEPIIPRGFFEYDESPREISLSVIQTILTLHTRILDLYNNPMNQLDEQIRLTIEAIKEKQEYELINNKNFGLIHQVPASMRIKPRDGTPTPDDLDEMLTKVWKKPAIFIAHPKAIAAFGREATRRGLPPAIVNFYGSPFLTWRGVPIIPSDKMLIDGKTRSFVQCGKTNILLVRLGEPEQGVVGLHQPGIPDERTTPSLSIKFNGINNRSIAHYALSLYFSLAVLSNDALAILENVEVGYYYDYSSFEYKE